MNIAKIYSPQKIFLKQTKIRSLVSSLSKQFSISASSCAISVNINKLKCLYLLQDLKLTLLVISTAFENVI